MSNCNDVLSSLFSSHEKTSPFQTTLQSALNSSSKNSGEGKLPIDVSKILSLKGEFPVDDVSQSNPLTAQEDQLIIKMLKKWEVRMARLCEIWGLHIYKELLKSEPLKKFAPEFARHYLQIELYLDYLHETRFRQIIEYPTSKYFISRDALILYLEGLCKRIKVASGLPGVVKNDLIALQEIVAIGIMKLKLNYETGTDPHSFSVHYFQTQEQEDLKKTLLYNLEKVRFVESAITEFAKIHPLVAEQKYMDVTSAFIHSFETFIHSLKWVDFKNFIKIKEVLLLTLCQRYAKYLDCLESPNTFDGVSILNCRVIYSLDQVVIHVILDEFFKILDPKIIANLFPSFVHIKLLFRRIRFNINLLIHPAPQHVSPLEIPLMKFEKTLQEHSRELFQRLRKFIPNEKAQALYESLEGLSNSLDLVAYSKKGVEEKLKPLAETIEELKSILLTLPSRQADYLTTLSNELKNFSLSQLKSKKKALIRSLEMHYFQVHIEFLNLVMLVKDIEICLVHSQETYVHYESDCVPDEVVDFISPNFEEVINQVIDEKKDKNKIAVLPAPALPATAAAADSAIRTEKKEQNKKTVTQTTSNDFKSPPSKQIEAVAETNNIETFKIRRGEKRRKILSRLREMNRILPLDEEPGKGSHLKLGHGKALLGVVPHRNNVKTGIGHQLSKRINDAAHNSH